MSTEQFDYVLGLVGPHISRLPTVHVAVYVQGRTCTCTASYDVVRSVNGPFIVCGPMEATTGKAWNGETRSNPLVPSATTGVPLHPVDQFVAGRLREENYQDLPARSFMAESNRLSLTRAITITKYLSSSPAKWPAFASPLMSPCCTSSASASASTTLRQLLYTQLLFYLRQDVLWSGVFVGWSVR